MFFFWEIHTCISVTEPCDRFLMFFTRLKLARRAGIKQLLLWSHFHEFTPVIFFSLADFFNFNAPPTHRWSLRSREARQPERALVTRGAYTAWVSLGSSPPFCARQSRVTYKHVNIIFWMFLQPETVFYTCFLWSEKWCEKSGLDFLQQNKESFLVHR